MKLFKHALIGLFVLTGQLAFAFVPQKISVPKALGKKLKSFEPSAVTYLNDLNQFLIASDDTTDDRQPLLFLMDDSGQVEKQSLRVTGLDEMTDIESVSQAENQDLYLLSSQGLTKKGKDKISRNLFVRASLSGRKISAQDSVVLRPLLLAALQASADPVLIRLRPVFEKQLDIESHFVQHGDLYVGLKGPQPKPGVALVLKVGSVDEIFSHHRLDVELWKTLNFAAVSGERDLLSDILVLNDEIILSTTQEVGAGRLWRLNEPRDRLTILQEFKDLRPEGLTIEPAKNFLMVVFDQGLADSFFAFGELLSH